MMKIFSLIILLFSTTFIFSQNRAVNTKKIDSLLRLKKEMINDYDIKSFYTIQLYSGREDTAVKVKSDYDEKAMKYKAIIEYETPNYKVWVGRFRTKLEADKAYSQLKYDYPSALIFRPGR
jgi:hypothetical protein